MTYEIIPSFHLSKDRVQKHVFTLLEYFILLLLQFFIIWAP